MQTGQLCFEQVYQGAGPSPVTVVIQVTAAAMHAKSMQRLQIAPTRGCGNPGRPVHKHHAATAEFDALTMAYNAVQQGAAGVDMGRNIFQSDDPKAMIAAVHAVVHKNVRPADAFEMFQSLKTKGRSPTKEACRS